MTDRILRDGVSVLDSKITIADSTEINSLVLSVPYSTEIEIGDKVSFYDIANTLQFVGYVDNIKVSAIKEITLLDESSILKDTIINDVWNNKSPEYIIEYIITNYTTMTYVSTVSTGLIIPKYVSKNKTALNVINDLLSQFSGNYRVDTSANFHVEIKEQNTSTKTLNSTTAILKGKWTNLGSEIVNSIVLIGDKQVFETQESFNGDGSTAEFTLSEIPIDVNVTVGGTEQTGQVEDFKDGDYEVDKENKKITFQAGSIPTIGVNNIIVTYTFEVPVVVNMKDATSIIKYGLKEKRIEKKYINKFSDARDYAKSYLNIKATEQLSSVWIVKDLLNFNDYIVNQKILVEDSINSITGLFIIRKVVKTYPGNVEVHVGYASTELIDWFNESRYRIKQLEEKDNNGEKIQLYELAQQTLPVKSTSVVTREQERSKASCFYLNDDTNGLLRESATPYSVIMCEENNGNSWSDI